MPRTKDNQLHRQRQDEILMAASRVFKAKGFHAARTEDICHAAGLSAGTVFRHFPDKRAMILAIAAAELEQYRGEIERLATKAGMQALTRMNAADLSQLLRPTAYDLSADSWLELARDEGARQQLLAFDKNLREMLTAVLTQGQKDGWVYQSLPPEGMANVILAVFSGLILDQDIGVRSATPATAAALSGVFGLLIRQ